MLKAPSAIPDDALKKYAQLMSRAAKLELQKKAKDSFLDFVRQMWPGFIAGRHHKIVAEKLERVARGELKRLIINMPPD